MEKTAVSPEVEKENLYSLFSEFTMKQLENMNYEIECLPKETIEVIKESESLEAPLFLFSSWTIPSCS